MSKNEQTDQDGLTRGNVEGLVQALRFRFPDDDVSATARLLDRQAPHTCDVVVAALPHAGEALHGEHSGPEVFTFLPASIHAPEENSTTQVKERDVGFLRFRGGTDFAQNDKIVSEIAWFYGDHAVPSMRDGPIAVNVFARFDLPGWAEFAAVCRRMKPGESRRLIIERVERA